MQHIQMRKLKRLKYEIAKIEAIQPATTTKDNAKEAIATKANERKTAIAQTQDITAEEIAAANADVDNAVTQANSNIEAKLIVK